ncbi:MAG TPA: enoyl-CoA hydratase [Rhodospirillaceae bacterium]|nr:enoyl-CoA hydratase [Rhodospirillaceae bacterium]HAA91978.1 enoyl-CoA hydratase [Rhodospirillaceae bacterium]HAT36065.1 enoyl-CoA hydratase [Rhodospirillaceae bacterium]
MAKSPSVTTEFRTSGTGEIATVTFDNSARANCLTSELVAEIGAAFQALKDRDTLRVAVLASAGDRAFCGGANVAELGEFDPDGVRTYITGLHNTIQAIRDLPVPVIAHIQGVCIGAGLEMVAGCEIRIAADHAQFSMPEVVLDIPSVIEAALLPRLIGWGRTSWMLYRGDAIDAKTAESWGLVEKIVPSNDLDAAVAECAETLAANGPTGMRLQKTLMQDWERLPLDQAIEAGIDSLTAAYEKGSPNEYIRAAVAKRKGN